MYDIKKYGYKPTDKKVFLEDFRTKIRKELSGEDFNSELAHLVLGLGLVVGNNKLYDILRPVIDNGEAIGDILNRLIPEYNKGALTIPISKKLKKVVPIQQADFRCYGIGGDDFGNPTGLFMKPQPCLCGCGYIETARFNVRIWDSDEVISKKDELLYYRQNCNILRSENYGKIKLCAVDDDEICEFYGVVATVGGTLSIRQI